MAPCGPPAVHRLPNGRALADQFQVSIFQRHRLHGERAVSRDCGLATAWPGTRASSSGTLLRATTRPPCIATPLHRRSASANWCVASKRVS